MARKVGTRAEGEKREGWEGGMGSIWAATCSRTVENKRKWRSRGGKSLPPAFAGSEFQLLLRAAWEGAPRPVLLPRAGSSASSREEGEAASLLTVLVVRHGRL
jgi:hypothetical protein